jgi:hypothetical protein
MKIFGVSPLLMIALCQIPGALRGILAPMIETSNTHQSSFVGLSLLY